MGREDDPEFEQALRDTIRNHTTPLVFSQAVQEKVIRDLETKNLLDRTRTRRLKYGWGMRRRLWASTALGLVASLLIVVWGLHLGYRAPSRFMALSMPSATAAKNARMQAGTYLTRSGGVGIVISASLAPVDSQALTLTPSKVPSLHTITPHALGIHGPLSHIAIAQLAPHAFTIKSRLYNNGDQQIPANGLEGMLFILNRTNGLNPNQSTDWEYFVDGPHSAILPHHSLEWSFTPNPSPPFAHLNDRVAHLVWMLRTPNPQYPTLVMGTLPVQISHVHMIVTGTAGTGVKVQFLTITANVKNIGKATWSLASSLGILLFPLNIHAQILSNQTYKYFDDLTPQRGSLKVLQSGQSATVQFQITGVPGANMMQLPLHILLVSRNEIGA